MACPFLQPNIDNTNNGDDNENDDESVSRVLPVTTTATGSNDHHEEVEEPLNYTTYLGLNSLLSALRCLSHTDRSDDTTPPVHDEHFFILIHQGNLKQSFIIYR
jgi:hypothetical protein